MKIGVIEIILLLIIVVTFALMIFGWAYTPSIPTSACSTYNNVQGFVPYSALGIFCAVSIILFLTFFIRGEKV